MKTRSIHAIFALVALLSAQPLLLTAGEGDLPGEIGDILYEDATYFFPGGIQIDYTPGHTALYLGRKFDGTHDALIHSDTPGYSPYDPVGGLGGPYTTRRILAENATRFTGDNSTYREAKTTSPSPTPTQREEICAYAMVKHDHPISYWNWFDEPAGGYESPTVSDLTSAGYVSEQAYKDDSGIWLYDNNNQFSCVGFAEAAYEHAGLNPTPWYGQLLFFLVEDQWDSPNVQWAFHTYPKVKSYNYTVSTQPIIGFSFEADNINPTTFSGNTTVSGSSSGNHAVTTSYNGSNYKVTITPSGTFTRGETVTVTMTTGVKDYAGNGIDGDSDGDQGPNFVFAFQIEPSAPIPPTAINLTCSVSPSSTTPAFPVTVSGTANYNNSGGPVPAATVTITVGGQSYTASVNNGTYSRTIYAPGSPGSYTVSASVADGLGRTGSASTSLSVDSNGSTSGYTINGFLTAKDADDDDPWQYHDAIDAFGSDDSRFYVWWEMINITGLHSLQLRLYRPDGTLYDSNSTTFGESGSTYDWWRGWRYWEISGYDISDLEGRWKVKLYVDGSYKRTIYFTLRYDFKEHRMCKGHESSSPYDPITPTSVFTQTDPKAETWCKLEKVSNPLEMKWIFYEPNGTQYGNAPTFTSTDPNSQGYDYWDWFKFWGTMDIQGNSAASKCGDWHVDVYIKDAFGNWDKEYTDNFRIVENPNVLPACSVTLSPAAPQETQSFTATASASDNTYLQSLTFHWNDGTLHSEVWSGLNAGSVSRTKDIGPFSAGQSVEYWVVAVDTSGNRQESSHQSFVVAAEVVSTPNPPSGPTSGNPNTLLSFSTGGSTASLGGGVEYQFDWGDGQQSSWEPASQSHSWTSATNYHVKARARSQANPSRLSEWSGAQTVTIILPKPTLIPLPPGLAGEFAFQFSTVPGLYYLIEASTNLLDWETVLTTNATMNLVEFVETNVSARPQRFYRVSVQQTSIPTSGLVAYYPFNGDANDASGNGHNATVYGVTLAPDHFGNPNQAYAFDGSTQRIVIPASPAFEVRTNITIAAWLKRNQTGVISPIVCKDDNQPNGSSHFAFNVQANNRLSFNYWAPGWVISESTTTITDTLWHHVAATFNGQAVSLYIDGVPAGVVPQTTPMLPRNEPLQIGEAQASGFIYLDGQVDEVHIYNRGLSDYEVRQLYLR